MSDFSQREEARIHEAQAEGSRLSSIPANASCPANSRNPFLEKHWPEFLGFLEGLPADDDSFLIKNLKPQWFPHFYKLERETDGRILARFSGTAVDEGVGQNCTGIYLDDIMHGAYSTDVMDSYRLCAETLVSGVMTQQAVVPDRPLVFVSACFAYVPCKKEERNFVFGLHYVDTVGASVRSASSFERYLFE